ncbi:hypothetical protein SAY87_030329 [Trapa incisa]|uniref:Fe2OG dioxygenase domain-containing protein n=1 Tax=Trapa incisa TaxID=236973 RepID=A0AAN7KN42_9MYRT|nr:hypothetical protein SAY87_030329 [Trapa incisa]
MTDDTVIDLPVLDISLPLEESQSDLLSPIAEACRRWGFFLIANHGVSEELYTKLKSLCKQLFSLPPDTKLKLGPLSPIKSYTPHFIASPFFESLRVSGPDFFSSAQGSSDVLFDQKRHEFCDVLEKYGTKMTELSKKIIEIMLKILGEGFDDKYYRSDFDNCHGYLRINNYSPPETVESQQVEGLGQHTDMSCITIVFQDEIGGLQVRSECGKWFDVSPRDGILVVNIGDMLQAWSNDRFRSSEHRVVLRAPETRLSLAFFWCFEDEKVVISPNEIAGEGRVKLYEPFKAADYVKFRESCVPSKFEKVGFTVKDFAGINPSDTME